MIKNGLPERINSKISFLDILGWKTKYDDYRFEWNPGFSFIIFRKQLFIAVVPDVDVNYYDSYWEAWLTYKNKTKGTTTISKLIQLFDIYSCTWRSYSTKTFWRLEFQGNCRHD